MLYYVNGNQARAARRPITAPAPTIHFGRNLNMVTWVEVSDEEAGDGED